MTEIYRSFEGKLDVENQSGFTVYKTENNYQVEAHSVHQDQMEIGFRFPIADPEPDWKSFDVGEKYDAIDKGREPGQIRYKSGWYSPRAIMDKNKDYNWRKYVSGSRGQSR